MSNETDILISGAGPGGALTALFLAKQGINCTLVDKATFPRDKICGDALSGKVVEVLKKLDSGLVDDLASNEDHLGSWGVNFVAPNTKSLRVPFKNGYDVTQRAPGFVGKRLDFDNFLVEQVRQNSCIDFKEGVELRAFEQTDKGIFASCSKTGNQFRAKLFIAADGAYSPFAKKVAGLEVKPKHSCYGLRAYYRGVRDLDKDNFIELHFLKEALPGYFWIFPLPNGSANVGIGMRSDVVSKRKVKLKRLFTDIIESNPQIKSRFRHAESVGNVKLFDLPLGSVKRPLSGDRYMLVGDAGALIDPFTGEGIGNAMMSGMFAAEQAMKCLEENNFSATFLKQYDKKVYDRLWNELSLSKKMQDLVRFPWLFNFVVNKARKNKTLSETISCMFEDMELRAKLKNPKFYFNLLFSN